MKKTTYHSRGTTKFQGFKLTGSSERVLMIDMDGKVWGRIITQNQLWVRGLLKLKKYDRGNI